MKEKIILSKLLCLRCGYSWIPRKVKKPQYCAKCNNRYWNKSRELDIKNFGERNGMWKGKEVGYGSLHDYIKWHLKKPKKCQNCSKSKELDLANISQKYKRDLRDWEWLCRSCHMEKDGRLDKLHKNNIGRKMSLENKKKARKRMLGKQYALKIK